MCLESQPGFILYSNCNTWQFYSRKLVLLCAPVYTQFVNWFRLYKWGGFIISQMCFFLKECVEIIVFENYTTKQNDEESTATAAIVFRCLLFLLNWKATWHQCRGLNTDRRINAECQVINHAAQLMFHWFRHKHPNANIREELHLPGSDTSSIFQRFYPKHFSAALHVKLFIMMKVEPFIATVGWMFSISFAVLSQQIPRVNSADIRLCMGFNAIFLLSAFLWTEGLLWGV